MRGPRGERRPAETVACAHKVFRIAVGDEEDDIPSARRKSGIAGAAARAKSLPSERRREIATMAAGARWSNRMAEEGAEMTTDKTGRGHSDSDMGQEFSRYPDNNLGPQVREFDEVPSLHEVVRAHFLKKK